MLSWIVDSRKLDMIVSYISNSDDSFLHAQRILCPRDKFATGRQDPPEAELARLSFLKLASDRTNKLDSLDHRFEMDFAPFASDGEREDERIAKRRITGSRGSCISFSRGTC